MPHKPLPYREVKRRLEAAGFIESGQRGSHVKFVKVGTTRTLVAMVPHHREVKAGTVRSILHQAEISAEEWETL